jgi:cobyrinic acid a,c-diamide synthase
MLFPRLVLAGAHSGSGKTTLALALTAAFLRRGVQVQPFKVGPDYIDPEFHALAAGRPSHNLDPWLMPEAALASLFREHAPQGPRALSLVEGVMGLFDGIGMSAECSTAHVASLLKAPVLLVFGAEGMALSAAAVVAGFELFRPSGPHAPDLSSLNIAGVILNRVGGRPHYEMLCRGIEDSTGVPCLGHLAKNAFPPLPHRHLGLIPAGELKDARGYIDRLADVAEESIDMEALADLAGKAPPLDEDQSPLSPAGPENITGEGGRSGIRIGVARDAAFSFYYQDNLDLLENLGAELVFFSPLRDAALPEELDGLYLGGGFPEVFAPMLAENADLRGAVRIALEDGLPAYAECGGLLYLCERFVGLPGKGGEEGPEYAMVGFFPRTGLMTTRLQHFGYVTLTSLQNSVLGAAGAVFPAHEFHYSRLVESDFPPAFNVEKPDGRNWTGGMVKKNVLAGFAHLNFRGCPDAARSCVDACKARRAGKRDSDSLGDAKFG